MYNSVQYTVYNSVQYTVYSVQYSVYSVHRAPMERAIFLSLILIFPSGWPNYKDKEGAGWLRPLS